MSYAKPEDDDPLEMVGTMVPVADPIAANTEMASCFVDEFVRMGWSVERIRAMFHDPGYRAPSLALRVLGAERIDAIIAEVSAQYRVNA